MLFKLGLFLSSAWGCDTSFAKTFLDETSEMAMKLDFAKNKLLESRRNVYILDDVVNRNIIEVFDVALDLLDAWASTRLELSGCANLARRAAVDFYKSVNSTREISELVAGISERTTTLLRLYNGHLPDQPAPNLMLSLTLEFPLVFIFESIINPVLDRLRIAPFMYPGMIPGELLPSRPDMKMPLDRRFAKLIGAQKPQFASFRSLMSGLQGTSRMYLELRGDGACDNKSHRFDFFHCILKHFQEIDSHQVRISSVFVSMLMLDR
jgi:hypothetical protein